MSLDSINDKLAGYTKAMTDAAESGTKAVEEWAGVVSSSDLSRFDVVKTQGKKQTVLDYASDPFSEYYWVAAGANTSELFTFNFRLLFDKMYGWSNVVFTMPLNPVKESRTQAKNITFKLSDGGYVIANWGNGTIKLSFSGSTGRLVPEDEYTVTQRSLLNSGATFPGKPTGIRETMAWKVFEKFNFYYQYFNGGNEYNSGYIIKMTRGDRGIPFMGTPRTSLIRLWFLDKVYIGVLTDFGYDVDANDPWQIKYSFKFESLPLLEAIGHAATLV